MKKFMDSNFLLENDTAKALYHTIYIFYISPCRYYIYRLKLNFEGGECKACSASTMEVYNKGTGEY